MLIGCGQEKVVEIQEVVKEVPIPFYIDESKINAAVLPHVMEFAGYCNRFDISKKCKENFKKIKSIRLVKSFSEKNVAGKCFISSTQRWVEILDKEWIDYDSLKMKTLIMHELGHCVLGDPFPHYDAEDDIMNSYLLPDSIIQSNWPSLIKNMFTRANGKLSLTEEPESTVVTSTEINELGEISCEKENF